ncbi:hypothetical protein E5676_scaffold1154G00100 [Cucumis melo var. makuwa]|uniref:Uncharacterized protein n=1 Tax=Cucumis melo var. makuwa TaxID=1194695 RepID=A0A5A7UNB3_CUCMM|nr:hypothetical protein E6C27_scaffold288G00520 [Cucumis melo var. makuwa]TYK02712.1 hypothetical protein E5676_scaffold1154G00100 [Cucumis melo var. makuwa]
MWDVVGGTEVNPPEDVAALKKWNIKAGKPMFAIKTTIDEEMLEHISIMEKPKKAWDTFASLFSKKNDARVLKSGTQKLARSRTRATCDPGETLLVFDDPKGTPRTNWSVVYPEETLRQSGCERSHRITQIMSL